jgi:hypothetical protein
VFWIYSETFHLTASRREFRGTTMNAAAIVLSLAALGGLTMLVMRLGGSPRPPTWLALGHGAIAATGVLLLAYAAATSGIPGMAQVALGLLLLAALGGITIFVRYHLKHLPLPIPFVLGHGLLALTAVGLLWTSIYQAG